MSDTTARTISFDPNGHKMTGRKSDVTITVVTSHGIERHYDHLFNCHVCDAYPELEYLDDVARVKDPCAYQDGITTSVTLAVPSGKMIVADDLRDVYDWNEEDEGDEERFASYNSDLGQSQVIAYMASIGCAFGPVGNSCPACTARTRTSTSSPPGATASAMMRRTATASATFRSCLMRTASRPSARTCGPTPSPTTRTG